MLPVSIIIILNFNIYMTISTICIDRSEENIHTCINVNIHIHIHIQQHRQQQQQQPWQI